MREEGGGCTQPMKEKHGRGGEVSPPVRPHCCSNSEEKREVRLQAKRDLETPTERKDVELFSHALVWSPCRTLVWSSHPRRATEQRRTPWCGCFHLCAQVCVCVCFGGISSK
ncbi:unnamed protein product [Arctogadus glacialis]